MTRRKKEKHQEPVYSKKAKDSLNKKGKSQGHNSILRKHDSRISEFANRTQKIQTIQERIQGCEEEIDKLNNEPKERLDNERIDMLHREIVDLERQCSELRCNKDEIDYLLESSSIIMAYSELERQEQALLSTSKEQEEDKLNNILRQKRELEDDYLSKFEENYISTRNTYDNSITTCQNCNVLYEVMSGYAVCPMCGHCVHTIETNKELSYKELQDYDFRPQFTYKKDSHLDDWLRRFQAKENREIPQQVLDKVILEAKKERITDLSTLTEPQVKKYLKKLELNLYYDNVIGIISRINGRARFTLTPEIEDKIKLMFSQIQEPFERYKPKNRQNFLSYSYTLNKFFKILGLHEFANYFPLLKSADKLRQQDEIFQKIVAEMAQKDNTVNWVFYPSI